MSSAEALCHRLDRQLLPSRLSQTTYLRLGGPCREIRIGSRIRDFAVSRRGVRLLTACSFQRLGGQPVLALT
jgi:hypothetical protein